MEYTITFYEENDKGYTLESVTFADKEEALDAFRLTPRWTQPELYEGSKLLKRVGFKRGISARGLK